VKRTLLILAVAALAVAWLIVRSSPVHRGAIGDQRPAPEFALTDLSGAKLSLSGYRGKVVLLDFWATWCEPCKTEIPHFIEMQNRYGTQGFQVIGISMDDDEQPVRNFQKQFKMNYPVAVGNADLATQYGGVLGLPITFLIDREGRIVARHIGETSPTVFEAETQKLLATK
jgi:peroxiredoxin